jgi:hypothetical protein
MGMFQPDNGPFLIERRAARRSRATCGASLQTLTGESFGELWDISETGARIRISNPPERGETAIVRWSNEHAMCRIVWSEDDMCGISFESPISPETVASTARLIGVVEQPVATMGNIPVGRRRSAPALATTLAAEQAASPINLLVPLSRPKNYGDLGEHVPLTAAEEMFLHGSPLSHVLAYEEQHESSEES